MATGSITKQSEDLKVWNRNPAETQGSYDNKWQKWQTFHTLVNVWEPLLVFQDLDLNVGSALKFVAFNIANPAEELYDQVLWEEQQNDYSFLKFIPALQKVLTVSISKHLS